jgi:hypothetical protein
VRPSCVHQIHNLATLASLHRRRNVPAHGIARRLHRIVGKVGLARSCRRLGVTKHLADNDEALSSRCL